MQLQRAQEPHQNFFMKEQTYHRHFKPQSHIQAMVHHNSPRFDLDSKTGVNFRKSSSSTVCMGTIGFLTVFVQFLYGSSTNSRWCMEVPLRTRVNHGGIMDAHDVKYYNSIQCLYDQDGSAIGSYNCLLFNGGRDNVFWG